METVLFEQVESLLGGSLVVVVDRGVHVPLHAAGFLPLTAALDLLGDVRLHLVEKRDLAHEDLVPLGFVAVDEESDQLVELVQDEGQRPDERIGVEDDAVARRFRQGQDFPKACSGTGIDGQTGRIRGGVLGRVFLDHVQVLQEGGLFLFGDIKAV